ncbi:acyl-homoserine-lactone synthase [Yoonia sp.]|uniref:acyl-homoserine-lactone synthase n=1 Tax=Yoonia sp. TaxID=2212373 RepID=UPI0019FF3285|nr:acyl-homoserine-lactone synthase [Yoonia sp.]MBE0414143.1 autoinducer synthase [Yoonia sp.]
MQSIMFNLTELYRYGPAFFDFLALRKQFFVDQLGWDIPHDDHVEMDQYDNPKAYYALVLKNGRVIGGGRTMATTAQWGAHTYMLRDAVEGKIIGIPDDIMTHVAVTARVWECTRVVVSSEITSPTQSAACLALIVRGLVAQAHAHSATEMIALSRPSLVRALRKIGYQPRLIGAPYVNADDGRRYVAMSMPVTRQSTPKGDFVPIHQRPSPALPAQSIL